MLLLSTIVVALLSVPVTLSHPITSQSLVQSAKRTEHAPEFEKLFKGNEQFRTNIESSSPGLLKKLTEEGQAPPFMFLGCSDSRVSEGSIFNAEPGTLFTERNIANQFHHTDANTHSVLSYAVTALGVKHVIVMGHYGCGGVAASIATAPKAPIDAASASVQNWIGPIRQMYLSSTRPEIVELRERNKNIAVVEEPEPREPGFRALVEENVKASVQRIRDDSVLANHFASLGGGESCEAAKVEHRSENTGPLQDVFVHGLVYDIETGEIHNLGVSVGPSCKEIPELPWSAVQGAAKQIEGAHGSEQKAEEGVKAEEVKTEEVKTEEVKAKELKVEEVKTEGAVAEPKVEAEAAAKVEETGEAKVEGTHAKRHDDNSFHPHTSRFIKIRHHPEGEAEHLSLNKARHHPGDEEDSAVRSFLRRFF